MPLSDQQRRFLDRPQVAVLSTLGPDGAPHAAAMWYVPDGDRILILTGGTSQKRRNMERDGRVALIVDQRERPYYALTVRGQATLDSMPASEVRRRFADRYLSGEQREQYLRDRLDLPGAVFAVAIDRVLEYGTPPN
jgi:PPOX class probable F420-dependent enzyme